jgi:hypothetical protein
MGKGIQPYGVVVFRFSYYLYSVAYAGELVVFYSVKIAGIQYQTMHINIVGDTSV